MNVSLQTVPDSPGIEERLHRILCELLLLRPEEVSAGSLLVGDLDVDSITLLELAFAIEREFEVDFPDVKTSEENFNLSLPDALGKVDETAGAMSFFEFVKVEALRQFGRGEEDFRHLTVSSLAQAMGGRVPAHLDANLPLLALRLSDLFHVLTVDALARYVEYLVRTQKR